MHEHVKPRALLFRRSARPDNLSPEQQQRIKEQFEKRVRAQLKDVPPYLYKYRSGTTQHLDVLQKRRIWIPSYMQLEDKNDGKLPIQVELAVAWHGKTLFPMLGKDGELLGVSAIVSGAEPDDTEHARLRAQMEELAATVRGEVAERGCYSLAANPRSTKLWQEHGGNFAGFCIEFDWRIDSETIDLKDLRTYVTDVNYWKPLPRYDLGVLIREPRWMVFDKLFSAKDKSYEWEEEWRFTTDVANVEHPEPAPISSIIFGAYTPSKTIERIQQIFGDGTVAWKLARPQADGAEIAEWPQLR